MSFSDLFLDGAVLKSRGTVANVEALVLGMRMPFFGRRGAKSLMQMPRLGRRGAKSLGRIRER